MSKIRYRLRELLPRLSAQANALQDREIKKRYYDLRWVCKSERNITQACEMRGISTDYFVTWAKRLLWTKSILSLRSKSRRPKKSPNKMALKVEKKIRIIKRHFSFQGPDRISHDLKVLHGINCHPSSVYRALVRLKLPLRKQREQRTKKHIKRYRRPFPGYLQMDIKYVPFKVEEKTFYQLSVIDHHSSWRFIKIIRTKTTYEVVNFIKELVEVCPFPIVEIQTDNGSEFTDRLLNGVPSGKHVVDRWCAHYDIRHKLIPIGQKELNGKVENSHKYDDEEFYSQQSFKTFEGLAIAAKLHGTRWSERRATKTLGWKTPIQVIEEAYVRAYVFNKLLQERYHPDQKPFGELAKDGSWVLPVPQTKKQPKSKSRAKPKKLSKLDRYFLEQEWAEKTKIRALLPLIALPAMSRSYSNRTRA